MTERPKTTLGAWLSRGVGEVGEALLAGLFPERCAACGEPIRHDEAHAAPLCAPCRESLVPVGADRCPRCGRPRPGLEGRPSATRCGPCRTTPPAFRCARAGYEYGGALADALQRFKYASRPALAERLAALLLEAVEAPPLAPAVLVPVPLHPRRLRLRGYNQSARLARALAPRWSLPLLVDALARTRDTPPQVHQPSANARARNVADAFAVRRPDGVRGRLVLLVDDVMTTGATADACARALRRAGADAVGVVVVARRV